MPQPFNPWLGINAAAKPWQGTPLANLPPYQQPINTAWTGTPLANLPPYQQPEAVTTQQDINSAVIAQNRPASAGGQLPEGNQDFARYRAFLDQMDERGQAGLAQQKQGIAANEQNLAAVREIPAQLDLSPLFALSDTWYGGNLSKGYTPPETSRQKIAQIAQLQAALGRERQGLSDAEVALIKQRLGGEEALAGMQNAREVAALKRRELNQNDQNRKDFKESQEEQRQTEALLKSEPYKAVMGSADAMGAIKKLQSFISVNGLPTDPTDPKYDEFGSLYETAKIGVKNAEQLGALTKSDTDITQGFLGPSGTFDMIKKKFGSGKEGILAGLQAVEDRYDRNLKNNVKTLRTTFKAKQAQDLISVGENQYTSLKGPTTVKIKNPNTGEIRDVPASQKDIFLNKGGILVQ